MATFSRFPVRRGEEEGGDFERLSSGREAEREGEASANELERGGPGVARVVGHEPS